MLGCGQGADWRVVHVPVAFALFSFIPFVSCTDVPPDVRKFVLGVSAFLTFVIRTRLSLKWSFPVPWPSGFPFS